MRIAIVWALVFPTIKLLQELGLDRDLVHLLTNLGIAVVVALLIDLIWQSREPVARAIRGAEPDGGAQRRNAGARDLRPHLAHPGDALRPRALGADRGEPGARRSARGPARR